MSEVRVRFLDAPTEAELGELANLFDQYRAHYAQEVSPGTSLPWLTELLGSRRLLAFVAEVDAEPVGFATTLDVPASLSLGHYWQVRDLFVVPSRRRLGVGRALLDFIRSSAILAGALRLAVQTESDNEGARRLYEQSGFAVVVGYVGLTLSLGGAGEG